MKKFSEIDKCKTDIESLSESLEQSGKKIPDIVRDIANLKTSRVRTSVYQKKIREIEVILNTQKKAFKIKLKELGDTITKIEKNANNNFDSLRDLKTQLETDDTVKHLGENDKERLDLGSKTKV
jgi:iron-sulfur cluster repair protein YtfE (RIC family)